MVIIRLPGRCLKRESGKYFRKLFGLSKKEVGIIFLEVGGGGRRG